MADTHTTDLLNALRAMVEDLENNGEIFATDQIRIDFMQKAIDAVKPPTHKPPTHKYNHAFSLGFSIDTDCSCKGYGFDNYPTPAALIAALRHRIDDLNKHHEGVHEAVGEPIDTYLNEEME